MAEIVYELDGLEKLDKELKYLQTHAVKVGILGDDGDKESDESEGTTVLEYALYNEYGTIRGIPARPFFRTSVATDEAQKEIKDYMKSQLELIIAGELTGEEAYNNLGNFVVKKIKDTID